MATILANGQLKHNGLTGSIHQVGKALRQGPCNGWEHWYYLDPDTGRRVVIDKLRQAIRQAREPLPTKQKDGVYETTKNATPDAAY